MTTQTTAEMLTVNLLELLSSAPSNIIIAARAGITQAQKKRALAYAETLALSTAPAEALAGANAEARELKRRAYLDAHEDYCKALAAMLDADENTAYTAALVESDHAELRIYEMLVRLATAPQPTPPKPPRKRNSSKTQAPAQA